MANSVIQIKRSQTDTYPSNVVFGELAFTSNGDVLFIGNEANAAIAIGGERFPGVLTANQAIVVDANSFVNLLNTVDLLVSNSANIEALTVNTSITATDITVANTLTVSGDIILRGDSLQFGDGGDVISLGATVNTSIIPTDNESYDLGAATKLWRKLFVKEIHESVDPPLNNKVDVLWKKIGFNRVRTDAISNKTALSETEVSDLIITPSEIWADASSIPSTKPASNASVVIVYTDLEATEDTTSTSLRTWKTGVSNWIPPRFGSTYQVNVYCDTSGSTDPSSNGVQFAQAGSGYNDEWYFDYQAGVLHFIGSSLPTVLDGTKSVFISGAKYNGNTGFTGTSLTNANLINATITSLSAPLEVKDGGTGVSSFQANSLLASANSSTMAFKTGSNGQVMLINNNDVEFSDLDGGTY